jgi:hypothetical protein
VLDVTSNTSYIPAPTLDQGDFTMQNDSPPQGNALTHTRGEPSAERTVTMLHGSVWHHRKRSGLILAEVDSFALSP